MENMTMVQFLVLSFACFRITHLIVSDVITAPFRWIFVEEVDEPDKQGRMSHYVFPKMPQWKAIIGTLISCPWCMGVWVGGLLVLGWYYIPNIVFPVALIFAIAGLGSVVETTIRFWTVNTYSPTDAQLEKFEDIKKQFLDSGNPTKSA